MVVEHQDLREIGQQRVNGMDVQRPEARREADLRLRGNRLVAEKENLVFDQQLAETVNFGLRQLRRKVDPLDQDPEGAGDACYLNTHF